MTNDNVSAKEIKQFNSQAAFWWDTDGPFKTLHQINPVRIAYMQQYLALKEKDILDVGCGGGILSEALAAKGARVTGIDMSESSIQTARLHLHESDLSIDYQVTTAEAFAIENQQKFDVVTCLELLEHVPEPESVIKACLNLVKADGWIFFSTINRNLKSMLLGIVAAEHILRIVPKGTHHYQQLIKPSELVNCIEKNGGEVKDLSGMQYNPFNETAQLVKNDLSINYLVAVHKSVVA